MKLICTREPINSVGEKIMNFSKGEIYKAERFTDNGDEFFEVEDDEGVIETFWNLRVLFDVI